MKKIILFLMNKGVFDFLPDIIYLKWRYRLTMGKKLNLEKPKTFNEKLQWLKLYNRNQLYTKLVDKYEVRNYIKNEMGKEYLIPLIGLYDKFEDIEFDKLPNQFVIKCNHDSGGLIVCKDKEKLDLNMAKKEINKSLKKNYFYLGREWPYKNVKPRIVIEKYMEDKKGLLLDYKFYCFDGKCDYVMVCTERETGHPKFYYLDKNGKLVREMSNHGMQADKNFKISKPKNIDKMFNMAKDLSKGIPFVRIDLYNIDGDIYFGEFTFFPSSGFDYKRTKYATEYLNKMLVIDTQKEVE